VSSRVYERRSVLLALACLVVSCAAQKGTIGAMLGRRSDGRVFVREAPAGLAADKAGVREGDEILLIDGMDVRQLDERRLHQALSGEVGDPVKLTLLRSGKVVRVMLKRTPAGRPRIRGDAQDQGEDEDDPTATER
jgi:C-terminal processing protease CtpA/Prc